MDKYLSGIIKDISLYNKDMRNCDGRTDFQYLEFGGLPPHMVLHINIPSNILTESGIEDYIRQCIPGKFKEWLIEYEKYKMDIETLKMTYQYPHMFNEFQKSRYITDLQTREGKTDDVWNMLNEGFTPLYKWTYCKVESPENTHILYLVKA